MPLATYFTNFIENLDHSRHCRSSQAHEQVIVPFGDPADRLLMIGSGKAVIVFDMDDDDAQRASMDMGVGDFIGDFAILSDTQWCLKC